jgi:hypothetical protein
MDRTTTERERELSDPLMHQRRLHDLLHASTNTKVSALPIETDWMTLLSRIKNIIGFWTKRRTTRRVSHQRQQPSALVAMEQERRPTTNHDGPQPDQPRERRRSRPDAEKREQREELEREWNKRHRRQEKTLKSNH